jgi:hypothetical protein
MTATLAAVLPTPGPEQVRLLLGYLGEALADSEPGAA